MTADEADREHGWSRRRFLGTLAATAAAATGGNLLQAGWAASALLGAPNDAITLSYEAGTRDGDHHFMGGTELRVLTNHAGSLFAGVETWQDVPGTDPVIGAQILRLDSSVGRWSLDHHFSEDLPAGSQRRTSKRDEGVTSLDSFTFTTSADGTTLPRPVPVLLAACRDFLGRASVYQRDDTTGDFVEHVLAQGGGKATVRSFGFHRDRITGQQRVFAGTLPTGIFSGTYTPGSGIAWDTEPELVGYVGRPMAFAVSGGVLYAAIAPAVWRRVDGPEPRWEQAATYPFAVRPGGSSGLRGLTSITAPDGSPALLAGLEGRSSRMVRIEPTKGYRQVTELDLIDDLSQKLHREVVYVIAANNTITPVARTGTGIEQLVSIQIHPVPDADAVYYVRDRDGRYVLKRLRSKQLSPSHRLGTTRTFSVSPFPADERQVVFVGGYDADNVPSHNTAYVLRAPLHRL